MDWFLAFLNVVGLGTSLNAQGDAQELNDKLVAQQAQVSRGQAVFATEQLSKDTDRLLSSQKVAYAKGGVTDIGSPENVAAEARSQAEIEAMAIIWGGEVGADTAFFQGQLAESASRINRITSVLNTTSNITNILRTPTASSPSVTTPAPVASTGNE